MEDWKDIAGFPGYMVDTLGRVYSHNAERTLAATYNSQGYYRVSLCKEGKSYERTIHRLVAETFIPNPENKKEVNHKDGRKWNNVLSNLEWNTTSENALHRNRVLGKINGQKAIILERDNERHEFKSYKTAAEFLGMCKSSISNHVKAGTPINGYKIKLKCDG
jgi:hypothetical protein